MLYGGPGDQFGTDIEAWGGDIYASGQNGAQGAVLHLTATATTPSWSKLLEPDSGLSGLSVSTSGIHAVGGVRPPTYGASDGVGDTESKPLLAQLTPDGELVQASSENFFPYRGQESYGDSLSVGTGSEEVTYSIGYGEEYGWGGLRTILGAYGANGSVQWKRSYGTDTNGDPTSGTWTRIGSAGYDLVRRPD